MVSNQQDALKKLVQEEKTLSAEDKLHKALDRLTSIDGKPLRTKVKGRLTLNKINNEAGLGRSYIHKFKKFVDKVANPAIERYNGILDDSESSVQATDLDNIDEIELIKEDLRLQIELKDTYRKERDEVIIINDQLETLNKSLMFRIYELQQQLTDSVAEYEHYRK
ncbi:hypothetical protein ERW51_16515 [Aliivibrio finisterrensis]|uniref:hypothetical protein n=1 Tax=Aliivibrio finisterrensis TaxID=511998 RepID=UPI00101FD5A2|nr:hypothetical protein [Aliivibrio finisterrensis]RYU56044.1 hypothetical protein ERW56_01345 [Aliivibrio finisterrensis]RYU61143.1 hypothetical protein ERW50_02290 [Aliivibrio finisterrensis]RYU68306.1 hypothetical protein ERW51_16515 [Aliivibrio finisterrensis]RYU68991.1 hypothetical protein ERW54_06390 [Aliivibrio finisterrensis]RYU71781.1 hypothetical protein ERW48_16950 [Aliivibrio finisterrensis]